MAEPRRVSMSEVACAGDLRVQGRVQRSVIIRRVRIRVHCPRLPGPTGEAVVALGYSPSSWSMAEDLDLRATLPGAANRPIASGHDRAYRGQARR